MAGVLEQQDEAGHLLACPQRREAHLQQPPVAQHGGDVRLHPDVRDPVERVGDHPPVDQGEDGPPEAEGRVVAQQGAGGSVVEQDTSAPTADQDRDGQVSDERSQLGALLLHVGAGRSHLGRRLALGRRPSLRQLVDRRGQRRQLRRSGPVQPVFGVGLQEHTHVGRQTAGRGRVRAEPPRQQHAQPGQGEQRQQPQRSDLRPDGGTQLVPLLRRHRGGDRDRQARSGGHDPGQDERHLPADRAAPRGPDVH